MINPYRKGEDAEAWLEEFSQLILKAPQFQQLLRGQLRESGSSVRFARSAGGVDYLVMINEDGETCYLSCNAAQNDVTVSSSAPA